MAIFTGGYFLGMVFIVLFTLGMSGASTFAVSAFSNTEFLLQQFIEMVQQQVQTL